MIWRFKDLVWEDWVNAKKSKTLGRSLIGGRTLWERRLIERQRVKGHVCKMMPTSTWHARLTVAKKVGLVIIDAWKCSASSWRIGVYGWHGTHLCTYSYCVSDEYGTTYIFDNETQSCFQSFLILSPKILKIRSTVMTISLCIKIFQ